MGLSINTWTQNIVDKTHVNTSKCVSLYALSGKFYDSKTFIYVERSVLCGIWIE